MKRCFVFFTGLFLAGSVAVNAADPCVEAQLMFDRGEYLEGQSLLLTAADQPDIAPEEMARIMACLAEFSEKLMGDQDAASIQWKKIQDLDLDAEHPLKKKARQHLDDIRSDGLKYREIDSILKRMRAMPDDLHGVESQIIEINKLISENPDYPRLANAHYHLGVRLDEAGRYSEALRHFRKALEIRPAIGRILPVNSAIKRLEFKYLKVIGPRYAWTVFSLFLFLGLILCVKSRPAQWFTRRHLVIILLVVVGWFVLFGIMSFVLEHKAYDKLPDYFSKPVFLKKVFYQKEGARHLALFFTGLFSLLGTACYAVGLASVKSRSLRCAVCVMAALVLSTSMLTALAIQYADFRTYIETDSPNDPLWKGAVFAFLKMNQEELPDTLEELEQMYNNVTGPEKEYLKEHLELMRAGSH